MGRGREGQKRYIKKRMSVITLDEFEYLIKDLDSLKQKSLVTLLYYVGFRIAEIVGDGKRKWKVLTAKGQILLKNGTLPKNWMSGDEDDLWEWRFRDPVPGIMKEDITLDGNTLRIHSVPLKHGKREEKYRLELDLGYPHVDLILQQWQLTEPKHKVWDMSTWKAWKIISEISEGELYPHAFRSNRATRLARDPDMAIADMQQWFGWARATTADSYIMGARGPSRVKRSIERELRPRRVDDEYHDDGEWVWVPRKR